MFETIVAKIINTLRNVVKASAQPRARRLGSRPSRSSRSSSFSDRRP